MILRTSKCLLIATLAFIAITATSASNEKSTKWLAENSKKEGVITLLSGLQYKVLKKGRGKIHPQLTSRCEVIYEGKFINGVVFDTSTDQGFSVTFTPEEPIDGMEEAMQMMVEGDKWKLYIPSELGHGDRGTPPKIGGGEALIFEIELLKIFPEENENKTATMPPKCWIVDLRGCSEKEKAFIAMAKQRYGDADEVEIEFLRIKNSVLTKKMSSDHRDWARARMRILGELQMIYGEEDEF